MRHGFYCMVLSTALFLISFAFMSPNIAGDKDEAGPRSHITTAGFVTRDLEKTVDFYESVLGFKVVGGSIVQSQRTKMVVGATCDAPVQYVALAPQAWVDGDKSLALISFFSVPCADPSPLSPDPGRLAAVGELILAFSVDNLDVVARRAAQRDVPIVGPLGDSGTSRTARSLAVLDPNGIRLELNEYK